MVAPTASHRTLTYLSTIPTDKVKGVGPAAMRKLAGVGVASVADLLMTPPNRYLDRSQLFDIAAAPIGDEVTIGGAIVAFDKRRISGGRTMVTAKVSDGTSTLRAVWFNPYVKLTVGEEVALSGKIELFKGSRQMKGPAVDKLSGAESLTTGRVVPVYGGLGGLKPGNVRAVVRNAVVRSIPVMDPVPEDVLDRLDLVDRSYALERIHFPDALGDVVPARKRLVFDEFLRIQIALRVRAHDDFESQRGIQNSMSGELIERYLAAQSFDLTADQQRTLDEIIADMEAPTPLHRLVQGEVGSGKTVVVVAALLTSVESGHQGAVMAPTEVLATQHYLGTELLIDTAGLAPSTYIADASGTGSLFADEPASERTVRIGLFTSNRVTVNFRAGDVSREQGLAWLADGTIDIAFGTHALIQPDVSFASLGITVVDEQHRFGVEQRVHLRDRDTEEGVPDLLLMTATPIPRTYVMALYGDLDVSTIETMPPGRRPVVTATIEGDRDADTAVDNALSASVDEGSQAFVVCPLVDDSENIDARSAASEFSRISGSLPTVRVGLLHGQMTSEEKALTMGRFRAGDIDVLVATTVVEVGIDVPNASLIVVRNAERFGLSQLHQLRGRVGRGDHPGSCLLVVEDPTDDAQTRIDAMVRSTDGFHLAEVDLEIRGAGTLFGASQSGAGDLRFGDLIRDVEIVTLASATAREAVETDRNSSFVLAIMDEFEWFVGDSQEWLARS